MQATEEGGAPILSDRKTDIGIYFYFLTMIFLKVRKKKQLRSSGKGKKEQMINGFLETEEIGTQ